jgi:hypothetical protein
MRLQAVFREDRKGNMLDISYFEPVEESTGQGSGRRGKAEEESPESEAAKGRKSRIKVKATKTLKKKPARGRLKKR